MDDVVAPPLPEEVAQDAEPEAKRRPDPPPAVDVEVGARPAETIRTPGMLGSSPSSHCRSVRYVTSYPSAASRSASARYQRSAPPTVYG